MTNRVDGDAIRALRAARRLTIRDVAERITSAGRPIATATLSNIETGKRGASIDLTARIAAALDVPESEISRCACGCTCQQGMGAA